MNQIFIESFSQSKFLLATILSIFFEKIFKYYSSMNRIIFYNKKKIISFLQTISKKVIILLC